MITLLRLLVLLGLFVRAHPRSVRERQTWRCTASDLGGVASEMLERLFRHCFGADSEFALVRGPGVRIVSGHCHNVTGWAAAASVPQRPEEADERNEDGDAHDKGGSGAVIMASIVFAIFFADQMFHTRSHRRICADKDQEYQSNDGKGNAAADVALRIPRPMLHIYRANAAARDRQVLVRFWIAARAGSRVLDDEYNIREEFDCCSLRPAAGGAVMITSDHEFRLTKLLIDDCDDRRGVFFFGSKQCICRRSNSELRLHDQSHVLQVHAQPCECKK